MPNLLNVNSYHYRRGGSDVVYLEHGAMFEALDWSCAYFSMRHPQNLPSPWSDDFVDEIEFGRDYGLMQKLAKAGKVIYSFEAQRRLRALIERFRPDVAHLHCIYHHLSPSILPVLRAAGVPTVMTAHDLKLVCPAYKMFNRDGVCERCKNGRLLQVVSHRCVHDSLAASAVVAAESLLHRWLRTYRRCLDRIVVPSRFHLDKFVEWGWPAEAFVHIPNWVDAGHYAPSFDPGGYVLYFGRLASYKGVATLLRASRRAGVALKIAGAGPDESALRTLQGAVGGDVEWVGLREGQALHDLVRGARAVVLPTEMYENAPMSVLEAFALGKPVVGARIGGIPELVVDGRTGWTFPSGDVDALAQTLGRVAALPAAVVRELGRTARSVVERDFSRERYRDAVLQLYRGLGVGA
jgi:glycosyltransferase involved in cell wall biosynthesis